MPDIGALAGIAADDLTRLQIPKDSRIVGGAAPTKAAIWRNLHLKDRRAVVGQTADDRSACHIPIDGCVVKGPRESMLVIRTEYRIEAHGRMPHEPADFLASGHVPKNELAVIKTGKEGAPIPVKD